MNAEATRGQASQGAPALGKPRLEAPALLTSGSRGGAELWDRAAAGRAGLESPRGRPCPRRRVPLGF